MGVALKLYTGSGANDPEKVNGHPGNRPGATECTPGNPQIIYRG